MNPYGDPQSARARARVPGSPGASTPGDRQPRGGEAPDAYRNPSAGGRAPAAGSAGRASVGGAPAGRAQVGGGSVGSARVGGRASVGQPGAADGYGPQAAVARAAVRPVSSGPGYGSFDQLGGPGTDGPGGGGGNGKSLSKSAKRRRRANILTAAAAVLVILLGAGVVGGTYFFDSVDFAEPAAESQRTQILEGDAKTVLATIGENRAILPTRSINPVIGKAVMAAEDKNFEDHGGIDMKGIARAAWNNFTGGSKQGASTITQQYARHAADIKEISYNRKLREAVLARKIESEYDKPEILGRYLNSVYFGRGAYGIEAAAKVYFNKSALTQPGQKGAITVAEAAVLASVIKQPEPDKRTGHKGYDPQNNLADATERWNYTLNNMVEKGWLPAPERAAQKYPKFKSFKSGGSDAQNGPTGKVVKYVKQELEAMNINLDQGGLRITTSINRKVQEAAEAAVNAENDDSPMSDLSNTYKSAVVAIDPENGRVLAYYGGPDAQNWDYAGPNGPNGQFTQGGRPPGSTFKIYTLLGALQQGYGMDTTWDSTLRKPNGNKIDNAGRTPSCQKRCKLDESTIESFNAPFYWIADKERKAVLEAARDAGVHHIEDPNKPSQRIDLTKTDEDRFDYFGSEVGFGQYAIFPLEHANGIATIANGGVYNKAHFVVKVEKRNNTTGKFEPFKNEKLKPEEKFSKDVVGALQNVLEEIPDKNGRDLDGRKAIGKTGTWEFAGKGGEEGDNGDAWMVGATRKIAAAVWIGNYDKNNNPRPIKQANGKPMSGGSVPGAVWKMFMDAASEAIDAPDEDFLPNSTSFVVSDKQGNGAPAPPPPPEPEPQDNGQQDQDGGPLDAFCQRFPAACNDNNGNQNNNQNNGNNQQNNGNQNDGNNQNNGNNNGQQNQQPGQNNPQQPQPGNDDNNRDQAQNGQQNQNG